MGERVRMHETVQVSRDGSRVYDGRNEYEYSGDRIKKMRRPSQSSETATINFFTDDREGEWEEEIIEEKRDTSFTYTHNYEPIKDDRIGIIEKRLRSLESERRSERETRIEEREEVRRGESDSRRRHYSGDMAVDYSSRDFRDSLATIDAASREGVRVRQEGDTTIVTEHRDPYSFYWQLDQTHRPQSPPRSRPPPTDYIIDEEEVEETVLSPHSHDSGVVIESQYSRPQLIPPPLPLPQPSIPIRDDSSPHRPLPSGWEKHQDPSGFSYYWHVDSGTIQRDPPRTPAPHPPSPSPPAPVYAPPPRYHTPPSQPPRASTPPPPQIIQLPPQQPVIEEHAFKQTTTKRRLENEESNITQEHILAIDNGNNQSKTVRFAVRSLGWSEIDEEDLSAERSSRVVNRVIDELSNGRSIHDNIAKWGDGRELILEVDENELRLLEPETMNVIHSEKIHNIRVWGVGRENGRDFAYISRDRSSRRFLCHVFRCDTPAKTIANTLRDICRSLVVDRRNGGQRTPSESSERRLVRSSEMSVAIDEPKKVIRCHFIGVTQVPRANGIDVLNEAVDRLVSQVGRDRWILSDVSIAPSTLTISEVNGSQITTCRVRYLSFLGIGRDIKHCAFIMQVSSDSFMCYVFYVEPSAAMMAKTMEAACKLRYQKLLDAHRPGREIGKEECVSPSLSTPSPSLSPIPSSSYACYPPSPPPPITSSIPNSLTFPLRLNRSAYTSLIPSSSSAYFTLPSSLQEWSKSMRGAFSRLSTS